MTSGVYIIRNLINGKVYVGSSSRVEERWTTHRRKLNRSTHHAPKLQNSWNKHGSDNFEFRVIEEVLPTLLVEREQWWMDRCLSYSLGYNSRPKAASCLGLKRGTPTAEHKRKNAQAKLGKNNPNFGKPRPEDTRRKMSAAQAGKPRKLHSAKTRAQMSESQRQRHARRRLNG